MAAAKKPHQINTTVPDDIWTDLLAIETRHGYKPVDFARRMVEAGVALYRAQGWFAFPIEVTPSRGLLEAARNFREALAVAEETAPYALGKGADKPIDWVEVMRAAIERAGSGDANASDKAR